MSSSAASKMTYRFLGNSGLLVSKFALGSWMFQDEKNTVDAWYQMMQIAFKNGVNLFDSAENYAMGRADELMGGAIKKGIDEGAWSREDLVVTAKIFSGSKGFNTGTPNSQGLNRKHLIEGTKASLGKMGLDYVDVLFCHHPDAFTPIEETVRAMNYIIDKGWAFYWGTSNWSSREISEACAIADRLGLIRPIVEQSQYSIFERNRVEFELVDLFKNGGQSSVPTGGNLQALTFVDKITPDVKAKIDSIVNFVPGHPVPDHLREIRKRHL
eukprot:jgi/Phyca11/13395/fgenesh1_pg.PHYCAscaffold_3_\